MVHRIVSLVLLLLIRCTLQINLPASEITALYDLYNATNGGNWTWTESAGVPWNFTADANPCTEQWQGVNCTLPEPYDTYYTKEIKLSKMNLCGIIPASIDAFTRLTWLEMNFNQIYGSLPTAIGNISALQYLSISTCALSNTLPATLTDLSQLYYLALDHNEINGTIPDSIGDLQSLVKIFIDYNALSGSFPSSFGQLSQLTTFAMSNNAFNGTIPEVLVNLPSLMKFYCDFNALTGTLPPTTNTNSYLNLYIVSNNFLVGHVPPSLGSLPYLEYLEVSFNYLTGPVPDTIGVGTPYMLYLDMSVNMLTGPLPAGLSAMTYLYVLDFATNALTGRVDDSLWSSLLDLEFVDLSENSLSGSLPDVFDQLYYLYGFSIGGNLFTGTIPPSIGDVYYFNYLNLYDNRFTGSVPESMGNLVYMLDLFLSNNYFTGTLPDSFGDLYYLTYLDFDTNLLHGTLPAVMGNLSYLNVMDLNENLFSGYLPDMTGMQSMVEILLQGNHFEGHLNGKFNPATQLFLSTIDLNHNSFTGTLPVELFQLPSLLVLSAIRNCFHGTLPPEICAREGLNTLALDGLSSAESCRQSIFPGLSGSYVVAHSLGGSVPPCLFHMPYLNTLHLSGNGLTGTLPEGVVNPLLIDLSVSHNVLTGSVPEHFQRKKWYNLDLSYNRLSGTLLPEFASEPFNQTLIDELSAALGIHLTGDDARTTLSLENNRLSGHIPPSLRAVQNISILGTNMFSCNVEETDLPKHDSGKGTYQCGSDSFDIPYYVWLGMSVAVIALAVFGWWRLRSPLSTSTHAMLVAKWLETLEKVLQDYEFTARTVHLRIVMCLCAFFSSTALLCLALILLLFVPMYAALSHYYSTTTYQYAWSVSAAFLSGVTPLVLLMLALMLLQGVVCACFVRQQALSCASLPPAQSPTISVDSSQLHRRQRWQDLLDRTVIYTFFIAVNLLFVVGANAGYVYMAIYKDSALLFLAQLMLSCFKLLWNRFFSVYAIRWVAQQRNNRGSGGQRSYVTMQMLVALLNNIVIPCTVVAVISPSCFYNIFVVAPEVNTVLVYKNCFQLTNNVCTTYESGLVHMPYHPPFTYNYQCSSSMVTYYAPAFVILCMVRTFATPLLQYVLFWLHRRATPGTYEYTILDAVLPPILKPLSADSENTPVSNIYQPYFDANQLLLSLVTYLGLLLTFGAVFPPLAVALVVTLLSVVLLNQLKLGRFLSIVLDQQRLVYLDLIESECKKAGFANIPRRALWMLITVSCWFYTLFLFDTLGDAVGFDNAYWLLIVVPLLPLVLFLCSMSYTSLLDKRLAAPAALKSSSSVHNSHKPTDPVDREVFNALSSSRISVEMPSFSSPKLSEV